MNIVRLEAENIKRLKAVEIEPTGAVVKISGKNEAGKTSVLDSIQLALGGKRAAKEFPLRKGQKKGRIVLDLGKYKVTRTYTEAGGGTFKVQAADGATYGSPQALLDDFLADFTFDPLEFAKADKDKQLEMLLSVVEIPLDIMKLSEIAGTACNVEGSALDCLNYAQKMVYGRRTEIGRDLASAKKRFEAIEIPEGMEEVKPVDFGALVEERDKLTDQAKRNEEEFKRLQELEDSLATKKKELGELENKIECHRRELIDLGSQYARQEEAVGKAQETLRAHEEAVEALVDPAFTEIDEKIARVGEINRMAQEVEQKEGLEAEARTAQENYDEGTERLKSLEEYRQELMRETEFPVNGLSLTEDGTITLEGVPISERGTSKQVLLGMSIVASINPELKVMLIRDGNDLDSETMQKITDWAEGNGFQLWVERCAMEPDQISFYIQDGELVAAPEPEHG